MPGRRISLLASHHLRVNRSERMPRARRASVAPFLFVWRPKHLQMAEMLQARWLAAVQNVGDCALRLQANCSSCDTGPQQP